MAALQREFVNIAEAVVFPFNIPTLSGFGASAGFNFLLQDRSGTLSVDELGAQSRAFLTEARQRPQLANVFTSFDPNYPQVKVELDREKARTLGIPVNDVFQAMSAVLGRGRRERLQQVGRTWQVDVQADSAFRRSRRTDQVAAEKCPQTEKKGAMTPLGSLLDVQESMGPDRRGPPPIQPAPLGGKRQRERTRAG